ncbi:MAG: VWA domain-containing protein [Bacilli bacterium]|nr:VWA domain-containing protein [Bacilli bacterium]
MQKNNKKRNLLIVIVIIIMLLLSLAGALLFVHGSKQNKNTITINEKHLSKIDENIYNLTEKVDSLNGDIITKEEIVDVSINVKSGNLNILDKKLNQSKKWQLDEISFVPGTNEVCITAKLEKNNLEQCFTINNYNEENIGDIDAGDSDNDGLKNYEEIIFGTDITKKDTDEDGLSDYEEIYVILTSPLEQDTDKDGIEDASEDFDKDQLINSEELKKKTSVHMSDTDEDGLNDYDELNEFNTNPTQKDTDGDGLRDYIEIYETNTDPNKKDQKIDTAKTSDDGIASVEVKDLNGNAYETLSITKANVSLLNSNIAGYILDAYEFNVEQSKIDAVISFDLNSIDLDENANPTIYYYNEETQMLEELETTIEDGKAYAHVNHFSKYILIDKTEHDAMWAEDLSYLIGDNYNNLDVVFVIDISASMDTNDPTDSRKQMMSNFISSLKDEDRAGVVLFRRTSQILNNGFSNSEGDKKKLITDVFNISNDNGRELDSGTNGSQGLYTAINMFKDKEEAKRYIIFLTDGLDTHHAYKYEEIYRLANEKHITILTIGLGWEADSNLLSEIAENTGGKFYYSENSEDLYENYVGILEETEDYRTDSNNDGISDYFTKLICDGTITTATGLNPFEGLSYNEMQKNDDQDKDGLKNGEEVKVVVLDNKIYLKYISDPVFIDSDGDGLDDTYDANPNKKFDSRFSVVDGLDFKPETPTEDNLARESNSSYNKESGNCVGCKTRAQAMVASFGTMPAALALQHFLDNDGTTYNFNNDWGLLETYRGKEYLAKNTNVLMQVAEETVKNGDTLTFATNKELTGTKFSEHLDDLADIGWWYAVGHTRATMVGQITQENGMYEMTLYYNIHDFYDWNKDGSYFNGGFGLLVSDAEMYKLHTLGIAKQYRIDINYKMIVRWQKGDRYYLDKIKLWQTPATMSVERIN